MLTARESTQVLTSAVSAHTWRVGACSARRQAAARARASCSTDAADSARRRGGTQRARQAPRRGSWRGGRRRALHARAACDLTNEACECVSGGAARLQQLYLTRDAPAQ
jgi:hypothetical protein